MMLAGEGCAGAALTGAGATGITADEFATEGKVPLFAAGAGAGGATG